MKAYLKVYSVGEGQFSNEYAVGAINYNGETTSGFFQKSFVNKKKKLLEVQVLREEGNLILLKAPGRFIEGSEEAGSGHFITVNKKDVIFSGNLTLNTQQLNSR